MAKIDGSDYFEINIKFTPQKKAPIYKSNMIAMVPPHIKEALNISAAAVGDSDKEIERIRRVMTELHIVQTLKHQHTHQSTYTLEQFQHDFENLPRLKEWDITPRFFKETLETLIHKNFCERVEGKKN